MGRGVKFTCCADVLGVGGWHYRRDVGSGTLKWRPREIKFRIRIVEIIVVGVCLLSMVYLCAQTSDLDNHSTFEELVSDTSRKGMVSLTRCFLRFALALFLVGVVPWGIELCGFLYERQRLRVSTMSLGQRSGGNSYEYFRTSNSYIVSLS